MISPRPLSSLSENEKPIAGGKACSLRAACLNEQNIPDGFVIPTTAFEHFVLHAPLLSELHSELRAASTLSEAVSTGGRIQDRIRDLPLETSFEAMILAEISRIGAPHFAVRSSAPEEDGQTSSWAGQFTSVLSVKPESVISALKEVWSSLYSPHALSYRLLRSGSLSDFSIAVFVQEMIPADAAGVVFSLDPVRGDRLLIEAVSGLGERLVSGECTPARYYLERNSLSVQSQEIPPETSYSLSARSIQKLAALSLEIEKSLGYPIDLEWCERDEELYVLQVRPITTGVQFTTKDVGENALRLKGRLEFAWSECHPIISAENWLSSNLSHAHIPGNESRNGLVIIEQGTVTTYLFTDELPLAKEAGKCLCEESGFQTYLQRSQTNRASWAKLFTEWKAETRRDPATLLIYYRRYQSLFDDTYALYKISQPEYSEAAAEALRACLSKTGLTPEEQQSAFFDLIETERPDIIHEEELALLHLSRSPEISTDELLRHGERFPWLFQSTIHKDLALKFLELRLQELQSLPLSSRFSRIAEIDNRFEAIRRRKSELLDTFSSPEIVHLSRALSELAIDRLLLKGWWAGVEFLFLDLFQAIAEQADSSVATLFLGYRCQDIEALLSHGVKVSLKDTGERTECTMIVLSGGELGFLQGKHALSVKNRLFPPDEDPQSDTVQGTVAQVGMVQGRIRRIYVEGLETLMKDIELFQEGEILLTTMTQPTMMVLARRAAAIVTNEGGITSHAAVIARELGLPCVVGTKNATDVFQTGDLVEVDAFLGRVRKLS